MEAKLQESAVDLQARFLLKESILPDRVSALSLASQEHSLQDGFRKRGEDRPINRNSVAYVKAISKAGIELDQVIETPLETGIPIHTGSYNSSDDGHVASGPIRSIDNDSRREPWTYFEKEYNRKAKQSGSNQTISKEDGTKGESKLELLVAKLWLGESIAKAVRFYYQGNGPEVLADLTNTTINAEGLKLRSLAARSQLWKAIILHEMGEIAHIPELLADVMWLVYTDDGQEADYYQFRKMLSKYAEETWQQLKLIEIGERSVGNDFDSEIDFFCEQAQSQYKDWAIGLHNFLDARFNGNEWPDPEEAMEAASADISHVSRKAWMSLEHRFHQLNEEYKLLLSENRRLREDAPGQTKVQLRSHLKAVSSPQSRDMHDSQCKDREPISVQELPHKEEGHEIQSIDDNSNIDQKLRKNLQPSTKEQPPSLTDTRSSLSPITGRVTRRIISNHPRNPPISSTIWTKSPNRLHWGTPRLSYVAERSGSDWNTARSLPSRSSIRYAYNRQSCSQGSMRRCTPPQPLRILKKRNKPISGSKTHADREEASSKDHQSEEHIARERVDRQLTHHLSDDASFREQSMHNRDSSSDHTKKSYVRIRPLANEQIFFSDKSLLSEYEEYQEHEMRQSDVASTDTMPVGFRTFNWQNLQNTSTARKESEQISPHTRPKQVSGSNANGAFSFSEPHPVSFKFVPKENECEQPTSSSIKPIPLIDENDVLLTDTPSPTKLDQDLPYLRKHQEQRRRSQLHGVQSQELPKVSNSEAETKNAFGNSRIQIMNDNEAARKPQFNCKQTEGFHVVTNVARPASNEEACLNDTDLIYDENLPEPNYSSKKNYSWIEGNPHVDFRSYQTTNVFEGSLLPGIYSDFPDNSKKMTTSSMRSTELLKANRTAAPLTPTSKSPPSSIVSKPTIARHHASQSSKTGSAERARTEHESSHFQQHASNLPSSPNSTRGANDQYDRSINGYVKSEHDSHHPSLSLSHVLSKLQAEQAANRDEARTSSRPSISSPLRQSAGVSDDESDDVTKHRGHEPPTIKFKPIEELEIKEASAGPQCNDLHQASSQSPKEPYASIYDAIERDYASLASPQEAICNLDTRIESDEDGSENQDCPQDERIPIEDDADSEHELTDDEASDISSTPDDDNGNLTAHLLKTPSSSLRNFERMLDNGVTSSNTGFEFQQPDTSSFDHRFPNQELADESNRNKSVAARRTRSEEEEGSEDTSSDDSNIGETRSEGMRIGESISLNF